MKTLITAATFAFVANSIALGQCSKSGGGQIGRPTYHPRPAYVHEPYRHVVKPSCHIKPAPVASRPAWNVTPPPPPAPLPQIAAGERVTIDGRRFGLSPGAVIIRMGQTILQAQLAGWNDSQAVAILPEVQLHAPTPATIVVHSVSGQKVAELQIELLPAARPAGGFPAQPQGPAATVVAPGQAVTLDGANLGHVQGQIQLNISGITLVAQVSSWTDSSVTALLPNMRLAEPVNATLSIVKANGSVADRIEVVFSPTGQPVASL